MIDIALWKEKFKITHSLVAADGYISMHGLGYCLQETAINHADHAGIGYMDLIKNNFAWVLTRQLIRLYDTPRLNQTIHVETWVDNITNHIVSRDFHILNKEKSIIALARTSWMMMDLSSRRPMHVPDDLGNRIPHTPGKIKESPELEKISFPEEVPSQSLSFPVVFSDLDMNHHVNNINYIKWILDGFDYDFRMNFQVRTVETNYLSEARYGEILRRDTFPPMEGEYLTRIVNEGSERPILSARTNWLKKE